MLRRWVKEQNQRLDTPQVSVPIPQLPQSLQGTRLLLVSDLHFQQNSNFHQSILQAARNAGPHCVLMTGDNVDSRTQAFDSLRLFLRALSFIAPCVAVLGNNDCAEGKTQALRQIYREAGVVLLENESRILPVGEGEITLLGMTDPCAFERGVSRARQSTEQGCVRREEVTRGYSENGHKRTTVMLLHRPELAQNFLSAPPALIVSGHAHGGQFRLPGGRGLYAPGQGIFPRLTSGLYRADQTWLYVSRGLGNHGFPLRINNRPHLPLLILEREEWKE